VDEKRREREAGQPLKEDRRGLMGACRTKIARGREVRRKEERSQGTRTRTFSNSPEVLPSLHGPSISSLDVQSRSDDGERHGSSESPGVLRGSLIVVLDGRLVDSDSLGGDDFSDLKADR